MTYEPLPYELTDFEVGSIVLWSTPPTDRALAGWPGLSQWQHDALEKQIDAPSAWRRILRSFARSD